VLHNAGTIKPKHIHDCRQFGVEPINPVVHPAMWRHKSLVQDLTAVFEFVNKGSTKENDEAIPSTVAGL
jgi:hypothetical protein